MQGATQFERPSLETLRTANRVQKDMEGWLILSQRTFEGEQWLTPGRMVATLRHEWYNQLEEDDKEVLVGGGRWKYCIVELVQEPSETLPERLRAAKDLVQLGNMNGIVVIYIRHLAVDDGGLARLVLEQDTTHNRVVALQTADADPYDPLYKTLFELEGGRDPIQFLDDVMRYQEVLVRAHPDRDGEPPNWIVYADRASVGIVRSVAVANTLAQPIWLCAIAGGIRIGAGERTVPVLYHDCQYQIETGEGKLGGRLPLLYDANEHRYVPREIAAVEQNAPPAKEAASTAQEIGDSTGGSVYLLINNTSTQVEFLLEGLGQCWVGPGTTTAVHDSATPEAPLRRKVSLNREPMLEVKPGRCWRYGDPPLIGAWVILVK